MYRLQPTDHYLHTTPVGAIGETYWFKEDWKKSLKPGEQTIEGGRQHSDIRSLVMGYLQIGSSYFTKGEFAPAIEQFQKALELKTNPMFSNYAQMFLSLIYLGTGRLDAAEQAARPIVEKPKSSDLK